MAISTSYRPAPGWTVDPFAGLVRDGRIYGRGVCDMKAGLAAAVFAAEAIERAGVRLPGTIEISGTVDEESGGFAGVAWLAQVGRIAKARTDYRDHPRADQRRSNLHRSSRRVLVRGDHARPDRARQHAVSRRQRDRRHDRGARRDLARARSRDWRGAVTRCRSCRRVPATRPSTSTRSTGGQPVDGIQTPCVADRCRAVLDRRFLIEEGFATRSRRLTR